MGGLAMMRWLIYVILLIIYAAVTFFGLGPVLFADGPLKERMITLGAVLLIYIVLTFLFHKWFKRTK